MSVQAESPLSDERLRLAVEQMPGVAMLLFDAEMRFTSAAGGALARHGLRPEEIVGRRPSELVGTAWRELEVCFAEALVGCRDVHSAVDWTPDGKIVYAAVVSALRDERGLIVGGILGLRDITAQRAAEEALARAESNFHAVIEQSADMLTSHDCEGRYLYVSPACVQITGYRPEELLGRHPLEFVHPDDAARVQAISREALARGGGFELEYRVVRPDGSCVWVHALVRTSHNEHGRHVGVGAVRDISDRKEQQARLLEATQRFARAFEHAPIGMSLLGLDDKVMQVNRALCRMSGYSESELLAKGYQGITHPDDLDANRNGIGELMSGERETYETEKRYVHADGRIIWGALSSSVVRGADGAPQQIVSHIQDITERKQFQERLCYLADHDSLTNLYNRRRFESELERHVSLSRRYGDGAALMMLDLDHFKYLNDALGHHVGDQVIAHVGQLLANRLRGSDILARLGGDEYAVILPRVTAERARVLAAELLNAIERTPFVHDGHRYAPSASAGVVLLDSDTASAEDALVSADLALHDAKRQGRNRVAVYVPDTREDVLAGLSWSQRLKEALANDGFTLHAQPIVNLRTGETVMHELLIRMRAADGQLVPPGRFLHAAAHFGYMPAIDRWVIAQAAQLAGAAPGRRLAVNLAANTISEPGLVAYVADTLAAARADPADVIFELSESDVIANLDHAHVVCEHLRTLGARIALDDFGSGFSGFSYLKALKIDLLKIDGQFVRELDSNDVDQLVIEAIVHVADGIGIPTVAEYVVNETVAQKLRQLGATYGQGFHLGKPSPLR